MRYHDFHHDGLTLRAALHTPVERGPVVVFVHGFANNRMENRSFVLMARLLAENGIGSVRFDLSGHGESDGDFSGVTITGEIAETQAVLRAVRELDFADPGRIALVGMSMGAVVAGIAAAEEPGIRALCLWSPAAVAPFEVGSGRLKGRHIAGELARKGYFDADGHQMSAALVEDIANLKVYDRSAAYTGPVLILHGDRDTIAPIEYARRYTDHYDGNAELVIIGEADHGWSTVPHRHRLHQSTLRFLRAHLDCPDG
ncbi:alpha/beta hydrolase [Acrocarpospora pleiomorpha]|uniref:Alpha/beta hydrolase n=1 Tax=Acrocarpospora pleiomorpha TaxID=90975 RepID=A0A5M3XME8_9ACTN|nr:alpha/beta fold hydrolase [Acrocarpospora pleiomorpha]GES20323.1 alpha/beta hydrolase [Acrocarpospora pleiomorpha]